MRLSHLLLTVVSRRRRVIRRLVFYCTSGVAGRHPDSLRSFPHEKKGKKKHFGSTVSNEVLTFNKKSIGPTRLYRYHFPLPSPPQEQRGSLSIWSSEACDWSCSTNRFVSMEDGRCLPDSITAGLPYTCYPLFLFLMTALT